MKLLQHRDAEDYSRVENFYWGDSKKTFQKNLIDMPQNWIWRDKKVSYELNSQSYRAPEWKDVDWNNSILLFGCSVTFGIGIDTKDTFAYLLSNMIGHPFINLGCPGTSPMFQWANSIEMQRCGIKSPKGVIYVWPDAQRVTRFFDNKEYHSHGDWNDEFCRDWIYDKDHCTTYFKYLIDSVNIMWGCPVHHFNYEEDLKLKNLHFMPAEYYSTFEDHARDIRIKDKYNYRHHPGPKTNKLFADIIFDVIRDDYSKTVHLEQT